MRIIKRRSAISDIEAIVDYIASNNPTAASHFVDILQLTFELLAQFPLQAPAFPTRHPLLQNMRKAVVPNFRNYLILYQPLSDGIDVIRVLHAARNVQAVVESGYVRK